MCPGVCENTCHVLGPYCILDQSISCVSVKKLATMQVAAPEPQVLRVSKARHDFEGRGQHQRAITLHRTLSGRPHSWKQNKSLIEFCEILPKGICYTMLTKGCVDA